MPAERIAVIKRRGASLDYPAFHENCREDIEWLLAELQAAQKLQTLAEAEVRRLREYVDEWQRLCIKAERERDGLRKALAAYRSALRSGEPESEQLREFGDKALKGER